ncbi:hypothetical protein J4727_08800 [Providencia rettgeri]|uniref:Uncharacterized protein n=1 Tax=Providencia rettgeri TaxID=587 RepID=A0A939NB75_PRORE|nr:hypothetical protein [Providencia rettgeri]
MQAILQEIHLYFGGLELLCDSWRDMDGSFSSSSWQINTGGLLICLSAGFCYALYTLMSKKLVSIDSPLTITTYIQYCYLSRFQLLDTRERQLSVVSIAVIFLSWIINNWSGLSFYILKL